MDLLAGGLGRLGPSLQGNSDGATPSITGRSCIDLKLLEVTSCSLLRMAVMTLRISRAYMRFIFNYDSNIGGTFTTAVVL